MRSPYDIIKGIMRTEKSSGMLGLNKYLFWVDNTANKIEIRKAIEDIYKVKVAGVNTLMARGKLKRVRYKAGMTPDWKKAIVTLKQGSKIDVT